MATIEKGANIPKIRLSKNKYAGQVVVITGAAQGIGHTTTEVFAQQGATIVLLDIQKEKLATLTASINDSGGAAEYHTCDITDEQAVNDVLQRIIRAHSKIDVLAHIAGIYPSHPLLDFPTDLYRKTMAINVDSSFFLVRGVIPYMQQKGYGRIILTSTSTFQEPERGLGVYVASKAAVIGLVRAAAIETGPGITINSVMPGLIKTSTVWDSGVDKDGSHPLFKHVMQKQVVQRCGLPEDIAHAVCYLASPEASFVTGQTLNVSGGETFN